MVAPVVKKLRSALGLTQPAFAKRLGISVRAIANYEKDRQPSGEVLQRLASLAARHNLKDLAGIFSNAFAAEVAGRTMASTAEETAYARAILLLLRNRNEFPGWEQISSQLVGALEALQGKADRTHHEGIDEALVELRYHAAPNAEKKIEALARARSKETGETFEQAYAHVLYERPDLYGDYLEDRAVAAKGTGFEPFMARAHRKNVKTNDDPPKRTSK